MYLNQTSRQASVPGNTALFKHHQRLSHCLQRDPHLQTPSSPHSSMSASPTPRDDGRQFQSVKFPTIPQRARLSHEAAQPGPGKRAIEALPQGIADSAYPPSRSPKIARLESYSAQETGLRSPFTDRQTLGPQQTPTHMPSEPLRATYNLTPRQKKFIRQWYETFASEQSRSFPVHEKITALATLVQTSSQSIVEYLNKKYFDYDRNSVSIGRQTSTSPYLPDHIGRRDHHISYNLKEANRHLPPHIISLVEKYVNASQRRRAQSDGRRNVNNGPYLCTYGCGYRTKRAFDWRRHEEIHEPQELWLCHLCCQNNEQNPFLVNRKDKFLKHVKDAHKDWEPETVLDMSKVDFHANFNPQCPLCRESTTSWEDRCRHVLAHYDDGIHIRGNLSTVRSRSSHTENSSVDESDNVPSDNN